MSFGVVALRLASALALVALNGFFVAVEFAVVAVRRTQIDQLVVEGSTTARLAVGLVRNPDRVIAASQLGITLASLALGWIGEATVAALIEPLLVALLGSWSVVAAHTIGTVVAFSLVTFTHIVVGEQVPKTIAIRYAERTILAVSRPMVWFTSFFRPLIAFLDGAMAACLRLLRVPPISGHRTVCALDELKLIVRESQEGGAIEADQEQLLQKVFRFGDRQVHEVMIPRPEVVGVERDATVRVLLDLFSRASHSRFPVYNGDLDDIVGIVSIKDVMRALADDPRVLDAPLDSLVRRALFVPETVAIANLLGEMRATHNQMSIAIDEFGGTAGIVTLELLVEEIVGRLSDELAAETESVLRLDERTVEVDAQLRIDEVNGELRLDLPEGEEYETLAGFLLYQLQRVPSEGDVLNYRDLALKVARMKGPKLERVQIHRIV
ncbi:hemolysin family protein [Chloroflexota bacterium]